MPTINEEGVQFYSNLIDELIKNDITPVATLYHWDLPIHLEDELGGWPGEKKITDLFGMYARDCFKAFGDRVKWWITLNEPWCSAAVGYEFGEHAPGITEGLGEKLYAAGHNLLIAHGKAVQIYRNEFQEEQKGKIGITFNTDWAEPKTGCAECVNAAEIHMKWFLGWFADPVYFGDYPEVMKKTLGDRLPAFTEDEKILIKGSSEFFGINHYTTVLVSGMFTPNETSYVHDRATESGFDESWGRTDMDWAVVPFGFGKLLKYIQKKL